jgi:hypothetical protein
MGQKWTSSEDETLRTLINEEGKQWTIIASKMGNRNAAQVAARWHKCLNPALIKGPFSIEEDCAIIAFVRENGIHAWRLITSAVPNRSPKQCRERWFMNLEPGVSKEAWTFEEDNQIFQLHLKLGSKWAMIARKIPGKTANAVKNRWNASISKRIALGPDGEQYLLRSTSRRYRKRKATGRHRPAPLVLPILKCPPPNKVSRNRDDGPAPPANREAITGQGSFHETFDVNLDDCDDSFDSPVDSPSWSLTSPTSLARFDL